MKTSNEISVQGRALVECTSNEGTFSYEPYFAEHRTLSEVNRLLDLNGNRVIGFRYTGVKAVRIQKRNWVSGSLR